MYPGDQRRVPRARETARTPEPPDHMGHDTLCHELLIYDDDHAYVQHAAPFLKTGIEEEATTILVTTPRRWSGVREALGPDAEHVRFIDRDDVYVRPAATIARYERMLREGARPGGPRTRLLAELADTPLIRPNGTAGWPTRLP